MPAYAPYSTEDLTEVLAATMTDRDDVRKNLSMFKRKLDDWEVIELSPSDELPDVDEDLQDSIVNFGVDPSLSYASKLDVVEKIMVSEFLWPYYKSMVRAYLMLEARIEELQKEMEHRKDTTYTVVHVDRGMLRGSFVEQIGYDNKWLFASDDEIFEDYYESEDGEEA
jgi:hypothetical protein